MSQEYHRGTHLGYLQYHLNAIDTLEDELDSDLAEIRNKHTGDERKIKEQQRLLTFREHITDHIERSRKQLEKAKEKEPEKTSERAEAVSESAFHAHQSDGIDEIPHKTGFSKASEMKE